MADAAIYTIDGSPVNLRQDWRHVRRGGGALGRQQTGFPGIPQRLVSKSGSLPPDVIVTGFLEGTGGTLQLAKLGLHATLDEYERMTGEPESHTIAFDGKTFTECELMDFQPTGEIEGEAYKEDFGGDGELETMRVRQSVRFTWRQLA